MPVLHAIAPPGLEPVVARELGEHGYSTHQHPGHVHVDVEGLAAAVSVVHRLRTPSRVLLPLTEGPAATLEQLARLVRSVDWSPFLTRTSEVRVSVISRGSRIRRRDTAQKKVSHALRDAQRRLKPIRRASAGLVPQHVRIRLDGPRAVLSIDVGGDLLHKRGWRMTAGKAPLRESLAASLLLLAGWSDDEPLLDPCCGAGTFCIEAGLWAARRSPYVGRTLACAQWPGVPEARREAHRPHPAALFASDQSERAISMTRENARRAGVGVQARVLDIADLEAPSPHGLLIANPPYGARLGQSERSVEGVYRSLGRALRGPLAHWRALFLAPSERLARSVDRRAFCITTFSNGSRSVGAWALDPFSDSTGQDAED